MGSIFGILAYSTWQLTARKVQAKLETEAKDKPKTEGPERVESLLKVDPLGLEVGYGLIPLLDATHGGTVLERIKALRRQMAQDMGIVVPPIRIRDNLQLPANTYRLLLRGEEIARSTVAPGMFLAMNPGTATGEIQGTATTEPAFGLSIPVSCPDVPAEILNPRNAWADKQAYDRTAADLAARFQANFQKFDASEAIQAAGPKAK